MIDLMPTLAVEISATLLAPSVEDGPIEDGVLRSLVIDGFQPCHARLGRRWPSRAKGWSLDVTSRTLRLHNARSHTAYVQDGIDVATAPWIHQVLVRGDVHVVIGRNVEIADDLRGIQDRLEPAAERGDEVGAMGRARMA